MPGVIITFNADGVRRRGAFLLLPVIDIPGMGQLIGENINNLCPGSCLLMLSREIGIAAFCIVPGRYRFEKVVA
jgi:hypothetical protein